MTSIIINTFYRALCSINDYTPIKDMDMKKLAVTLVDALYPEDGYITLEDKPQGVFRVHLEDHFLDRVRAEIGKGLGLKEATEAVGLKAEPEPEQVKQVVEVPVVAAAPAPEVKEVKTEAPKPAPAPKPKAAPKPKLTEEEKAAAKEAEKAAKAAAKEAEKAAAKAAKEAEKAAAKSAPKAKFVGNLEKLNPTQVKTWKKVAAEAKVELTDDHLTRFLAAMNALDNTVYNQKKMEAHMSEFFTPKAPEVKTENRLLYPVEYQGKTYDVSEDGVVYDEPVGDNPAKKLGHAGMAFFSGMQKPNPADYRDDD
jgi:chemotaxis protein histidine kinase CheA